MSFEVIPLVSFSLFGKTALNDVSCLKQLNWFTVGFIEGLFCSDGDECLGHIINNFAVS
jgi:hypothetical protein